MKIGSIVECIDNTGFEEVLLNTPYTVSAITPINSIVGYSKKYGTIRVLSDNSIELAEIETKPQYSNVFDCMITLGYPMKKFRELEFPDPEELELLLADPDELVLI